MNSTRVASAHCRSSKSSTTGSGLRHALEEQPPGAEELLLAVSSAFVEPEQMRKPGLDESSLLRIRYVLLDRRPHLPARTVGVLAFRDLRAHANHLRKRPERDALAVGEAPSAVPPDVLGETVDVLEELPAQARLADAGDADDGHEVRPSLRRGGVEELLDEPELSVPSHERRLQTRRLERSTPPRRDPQRLPGSDRLGLPLELVLSGGAVRDRRLGRPPRRLPHEHRARLGRRLNARRSVDEVTGDHALALGADRDGRLSREHARARANPRSEIGNCADQIERRAHCPLGVVLLRDRRPPDRHHRVADELLHGSAVALDQPPAGVEVAGQQFAHLLGVSGFGGAREADQVSEKHGHQPAFGDREPRAATGAIPPSSEAPHSPQNRTPGSFPAPQAGHAWLSSAPQPPQNLRPGLFSVPQLAQIVMR